MTTGGQHWPHIHYKANTPDLTWLKTCFTNNRVCPETYFKTIFNLHHLQFFLSLKLLVLFTENSSWNTHICMHCNKCELQLINSKASDFNYCKQKHANLMSSICACIHIPEVSFFLWRLRCAMICPGSQPSHVSVPMWMWKDKTVSPIFTSSPWVRVQGSQRTLGCRVTENMYILINVLTVLRCVRNSCVCVTCSILFPLRTVPFWLPWSISI